MGSSSSKVASRAAGAAKRQYPSTASSAVKSASQPTAPAPPQPTTTAASPVQVHPSPTEEPPSSKRSEVVELDGRDPQFGAALSRAGRARRIPQPPSPTSPAAQSQSAFPTSSQPPKLQQSPVGQSIFPSSNPGANPALAVVQARDRLTKLWQMENEGVGRKGFQGRTLLSAKELREVMNIRAVRGEEEAEKMMRLKKGLLAELPVGVVGNT